MSLEELVHDVESRLADIGRRLIQPGPKTLLQEEIDTLARELEARRAALARAKAERDATARRILDGHSSVRRLTALVEHHVRRHEHDQGWQYALELDRARQALAEDRAALPRHEQACWSLQFKLRQLERKLARLEEQLDPHQAKA
jgi:chromosome segregation ATPase